MADVFNWDSLDEHTILPGFHGKFVHSAKMTIARWRIEPGAKIPEHHHPHEQMGVCLSGSLAVVMNGKANPHASGDVLLIPPDTPHAAEALTETYLIDVFTPVREDFQGDFKHTLLNDFFSRATDADGAAHPEPAR